MASPRSTPLGPAIKKSLAEAIQANPGDMVAVSQAMGVNPRTIRQWSQDDEEVAELLAEDKSWTHAKVEGYLTREAVSGKSLVAAIYYSKAQLGWSDRQTIEHKGRVEFDIPAAPAKPADSTDMAMHLVIGTAPALDPAGEEQADE